MKLESLILLPSLFYSLPSSPSSSSSVLLWLLIYKTSIRASQFTNVNQICPPFSCFPCKSRLLLLTSFADQSFFFKLPTQIKAASSRFGFHFRKIRELCSSSILINSGSRFSLIFVQKAASESKSSSIFQQQIDLCLHRIVVLRSTNQVRFHQLLIILFYWSSS